MKDNKSQSNPQEEPDAREASYKQKAQEIRETFSRNLKRMRIASGKAQLALALDASITPNFLNDLEKGKKWASVKTFAQLSVALNAELFRFFLSEQGGLHEKACSSCPYRDLRSTPSIQNGPTDQAEQSAAAESEPPYGKNAVNPDAVPPPSPPPPSSSQEGNGN